MDSWIDEGEEAKIKTKLKVNLIHKNIQSEEEIQRFTVNDKLSDSERIAYILSSGTNEQKIYVFAHYQTIDSQ